MESPAATTPTTALPPTLLGAEALDRLLTPMSTDQLLRQVLAEVYPGRAAVATSFGSESAVLLALVAAVNPSTPVLFLDTGLLFAQTLSYRDRLITHLGLTDVRTIRPDPADLAREDADGTLNRRDPDRCCHLRKVLPMERALEGFDVWISGRKRYHGGARGDLPRVEFDGRHLKINPLADWRETDIADFYRRYFLPRHPLVEQGFGSIGCFPCTEPSGSGSYSREGRWAGRTKTECGIHKSSAQRSRSVADA